MNKILVSLTRDGWVCRFVGPHAASIVELFGTDTIPSAYTARCSGSDVLAGIRALNPGVEVECESALVPAGWDRV